MGRGTIARRAVLLLAVVVCLSALGAGTVGAENVTISNPTEGEVGDHEWNTTVSKSGTLEYLIINYTGTGVNLTELTAYIEEATITVNGTSVAINATQTSRTSTTLNATLETSASIAGGDRIKFVLRNVRNPPSNGTYSASIELNNSSSQFASSSESFTIVEGGYVNGTVKNKTGTPLTSAFVSIYNNSTGEFVTGYGVDPSTGEYTAHIPAGEYRFDYTADGYTTNSTTIQINTSESKNNINATLVETGFINGTVTDSDGNALGGIQLTADPRSGSGGDFNITAPDGSFSLEVGPGRYDIVAFNNPNYEFNIKPNVSVTSGATTIANVTLTELPDKGTISGRLVDADGNGVSGKRVFAGDTSYQYYNSTVTNSTGYFTMKVPAATYRLRANSSPTARLTSVDVTANDVTSVEMTVPERAYLTGKVSNSSGSIPRATVIADSGTNIYVNRSTNSSGYYNITAPPGNYSLTVLLRGQTAKSKTASVDAGNVTRTDFTAKPTAVTSQSVSITSGPGDEANLSTRGAVRGGLLQVQLVDERNYARPTVGPPGELETLGVTSQTEFEINITVTNFSADSLLWAIENAEYSTTQSANNPDATNVTIRGNATTLQANLTSAGVGPLLTQDPSDVRWPTGRADRAGVGFNQTVYFGIFDFNATPGQFEDSLNGASVTTNAQRFSAPTVQNETLRIWVGAPSKTVEGKDHTGFYQATIPDSQLNEWGVDDPESELQTFYKGSQANFTVEETANGARVILNNISYSAGFVEIEANPSSDGGGGSTSGSTGGDDDSEPSLPSTTASVAGDRVQLSLENARAGEPVSIDVPSSPAMEQTGVRMRSVKLTLTRSGDASLDIITAATPSQPTPEDTEALFAYEVATDLTDEDIDRATIRLTIDPARVETPKSVTALRRTHDGWESVETTFVESADGALVYEVKTTKFSEFAVVERVESTATATEEPTATPTQTEEPTATPTQTEEPTVTPTATATPAPTTTSTTQPGFGVIVALVALLSSAVVARRRS